MSYPGLTPTAKLMWARLAQYAGKDGGCFPSQSRLARDLGISDRHVRNVLAELVKEGFLEKVAPPFQEQIQGKTCKYFFLYHPVFNPQGDTQVPEILDRNSGSALERNSGSGGYGTVVPPAYGTTVPTKENQYKEKKEKGSLDNLFEENKQRANEILSKLCGGNSEEKMEERKEALKVKKGRKKKGKKRGPEGSLNRSEG
jgi:hypothetical protein